MNTSPTPAVIYPRVSSKRQVIEGDGLRSQEQRCRDYAAAQGYAVLKVFNEPAIRGAVLNRPAMKEMLAFLEAQERETVVIIEDLKRFAREVKTHFELKAAIMQRGGRLESPTFRFEDTPEGEFVETVIAAQAQLERKQNLRQVMNRMRARLEQGYWTFYPCPGYRYAQHTVHKKVLVRDESTAPLVQEALQGYADNRFASASEVCRFLLSAGFFGLQRSQHPCRHLMLVHRMLRQVLYTGYVEYKPWGISLRKGHHPALISLETFERIQEKLEGRGTPAVRQDTHEDFPLRNFVACSACGYRLTAAWTKGKCRSYPYYRCHRPTCALYGRGLPKAEVEDAFAALLKRLDVHDEVIEMARQLSVECWKKTVAAQENTAALLERRLREIAQEEERLADRISKTESDAVVKSLEAQLERLASERCRLENKAAYAKEPLDNFEHQFDRVRSMLKSPYQTWKDGDLAMKRTVTRMVFVRPIPYVPKAGLGTPSLSLPYGALRDLAAPDSDLVDTALESWNTCAGGEDASQGARNWDAFVATIQSWAAMLNHGSPPATEPAS